MKHISLLVVALTLFTGCIIENRRPDTINTNAVTNTSEAVNTTVGPCPMNGPFEVGVDAADKYCVCPFGYDKTSDVIGYETCYEGAECPILEVECIKATDTAVEVAAVVSEVDTEVNQNVNSEPVNTNTTEPSVPPAVEHSIKITSPEDYSVFDGSTSPITYKGEVSEGATKIVVTADFTYLDLPTGKSYPKQDIYTLSGFTAGDTTFEYGVKESWNNLGLEENTYTFTAYFEDGTQASTTQKMCYQMEVYYPPSCW